METPNNRDALLVELRRVLAAVVSEGTASLKPEVLRVAQAALESGRARIGFLIEMEPLGIDCLALVGNRIVPLFVIRSGTVDAPASTCN